MRKKENYALNAAMLSKRNLGNRSRAMRKMLIRAAILICIFAMAGAGGAQDGSRISSLIKREPPPQYTVEDLRRLIAEENVKLPVDATPEEIQKIKGKKLSEIIPIGQIKEIRAPHDPGQVSDDQIQKALLDCRIVNYSELPPLHLMPCHRFVVQTEEDQFVFCVFRSGDNRGMITLPDQKRYWFALLGD